MGRNKGKGAKRNKKKNYFKNHSTEHHIWPSSRGGTDADKNILCKSGIAHAAWHTLFANLLPEEAIVLIKYCWTDENGNLKRDILGEHNLIAWENVFGNASPAEAIEIIKKEWM